MGVTNPHTLVLTPSLYRHGHQSKEALPDQPCYTVVDTIIQHKNITDTVSKVVHQYRLPPRKAIQPTLEEGASLTMFTSQSFFALFHSVRLVRKAQFERRVKKYFIFCNSGQFDYMGSYRHKKSLCPLLGKQPSTPCSRFTKFMFCSYFI